MDKKEFFESIAKVREKDPKKAEAIYRVYKEDPTRTWEDLELLASKAPADVIARESKGTRREAGPPGGIRAFPELPVPGIDRPGKAQCSLRV